MKPPHRPLWGFPFLFVHGSIPQLLGITWSYRFLIMTSVVEYPISRLQTPPKFFSTVQRNLSIDGMPLWLKPLRVFCSVSPAYHGGQTVVPPDRRRARLTGRDGAPSSSSQESGGSAPSDMPMFPPPGMDGCGGCGGLSAQWGGVNWAQWAAWAVHSTGARKWLWCVWVGGAAFLVELLDEA